MLGGEEGGVPWHRYRRRREALVGWRQGGRAITIEGRRRREAPVGRRRDGWTITADGRRRKEGAVAGANQLEGRADERMVASGESLLIVWRPVGILGLLLLQAAATAAMPIASAPSPLRVLRGRRWWRQRVIPGGCGRT